MKNLIFSQYTLVLVTIVIEWNLVDGGNKVRVVTSFGSRVFDRDEWIDLYRKCFMGKPRLVIDSKEIILTTAEEERKLLIEKSG